MADRFAPPSCGAQGVALGIDDDDRAAPGAGFQEGEVGQDQATGLTGARRRDGDQVAFDGDPDGAAGVRVEPELEAPAHPRELPPSGEAGIAVALEAVAQRHEPAAHDERDHQDDPRPPNRHEGGETATAQAVRLAAQHVPVGRGHLQETAKPTRQAGPGQGEPVVGRARDVGPGPRVEAVSREVRGRIADEEGHQRQQQNEADAAGEVWAMHAGAVARSS